MQDPSKEEKQEEGRPVLRINKMEMGPNNLEVDRVTENSVVGEAPPTPMIPPAQLYPQAPRGMENED